MKPTLKTCLNKLGPCMSSKLVDRLVSEESITREHARKLISRAIKAGEIHSLNNIFPKRENFIYLREFFGCEMFWEHLVKDLIACGSALGLALSAVKARGGVIPLSDFGAACGSPVAMQKKLSVKMVLDKLIAIGLLNQVSIAGIGDCVVIKQKEERFDVISHYIKARLITESVLINAVVQWAQNLSLVSYDSVRTRLKKDTNNPRISNFLFDITAPSYLSPLLQFDKSGNAKPGFLGCDVLLGTKMSLSEVAPFINKCRALLSLKNIGRCLFIMVASEFTLEAFHELKRNGIIPATPDNLFGKDIGKSLRELNDFLNYHIVGHSGSIDVIDSLMTKLTEINGAAAQLQGALFEYLVAEVVKDKGHIRIGRVCSHNGKKAECDVFIDAEYRGVTFIECKGYRPYATIPHELVKHWIGVQIPVFREQARTDYSTIDPPDIKIELWTTGKLSDESLEAINNIININKVNKRCVISYLDAHEVKVKFHDTKNKNLIAVYEKHFLNTYSPDKPLENHPSYLLASGPDEQFEDITSNIG